MVAGQQAGEMYGQKLGYNVERQGRNEPLFVRGTVSQHPSANIHATAYRPWPQVEGEGRVPSYR